MIESRPSHQLPIESPKIRERFLAGEKEDFVKHLEDTHQIAQKDELPIKVLKYLNLYRTGLPLDPTVRYLPAIKIEDAVKRINQLSDAGFETWVSFAPLDPPNPLVSIQRGTPLVKNVRSREDYFENVIPKLEALPIGTWIKLFYDTHGKELENAISGAIRISSGGSHWGDKRDVAISWGKTTDVRQVGGDSEGYIVWSPEDPTWRYGDRINMKLKVTDPAELGLVNTIFGFRGIYRKRMAALAQKEGRGSISFEFKIRPGTFLPLFFIDYEFAGEPGSGSFSWFYYGHEGD